MSKCSQNALDTQNPSSYTPTVIKDVILNARQSIPVKPRNQSNMMLQAAINLSRAWLKIGGNAEVDLAALEPLLWREGAAHVPDLVAALKELRDFSGNSIQLGLTTNGLLLGKYAAHLRNAGIDKVRVSWHSCEKEVFSSIVGTDCYSAFLSSIEKAIKLELPISFNRVLIKGFTQDLGRQLDFVRRWNVTIKLYDLYWTPTIARYYKQYYVHWKSVVDKYVLPLTEKHEEIRADFARERHRFHLVGGGVVEVKTDKNTERHNKPCSSCGKRKVCLEAFGEYLRVDPDMTAIPCYLRRDLQEDLRNVANISDGGSCLSAHLERVFGTSWRSMIAEMRLRLVVVPFCNFKCTLPGTDANFCLKTLGAYSFVPKTSRIS